jgi:hypothetical protein
VSCSRTTCRSAPGCAENRVATGAGRGAPADWVARFGSVFEGAYPPSRGIATPGGPPLPSHSSREGRSAGGRRARGMCSPTQTLPWAWHGQRSYARWLPAARGSSGRFRWGASGYRCRGRPEEAGRLRPASGSQLSCARGGAPIVGLSRLRAAYSPSAHRDMTASSGA